MIGELGLPELIFIFSIALLFFGAGRISEIAMALGKRMKEFKKSGRDLMEDENDKTSDTATKK